MMVNSHNDFNGNKTLYTALIDRKEELLETWMHNILSLSDSQTLSLMSKEQVKSQAEEFLDALLHGFCSGNYVDIQGSEYRRCIQKLQEISSFRAKQGFTPTETALFVFSIKDATLSILQEAFDSDRLRLASEIIKLNTIIDKLGLLTFEIYSQTREKVIAEQNRTLVELAESANRAKSLFLASMSHEIRTPIHAITGMGELLSEITLSNEGKEYVQIINHAGEALLALVNDILDYSKIEAGQFELEESPVDLRNLIGNTLSILFHKAQDKGLLLTHNVDENVPETIIADADRLRQILLNLIGNAIKFTSTGEISIQTTVLDEKIQISVSDSGIGIPKDKQEIIFEPFAQSDSSTRHQYGGTGLGLTICSQLIQLMDGSIRVESQVGKGSRFYFEWPIKISQKKMITPKDKQHQKQYIPSKTSSLSKTAKKILLAEDTPENRLLLTMFLKHTNWQIDEATNGAEAYQKFTTNPYDLVLMDVEMPILNGYAATQSIRQWEKDHNLKRTPIIALTAHAMREYRERSLEAGCDRHLVKPIRKKQLLNVVEEALG
ncbi:MAG: response regulator [Magnetococcales bacterium]|nr:response regulator [Magnetococcales bacterium]